MFNRILPIMVVLNKVLSASLWLIDMSDFKISTVVASLNTGDDVLEEIPNSSTGGAVLQINRRAISRIQTWEILIQHDFFFVRYSKYF